MREITLDSLTQQQKDASEQLLVNLIRSKYPHLDIRSGTALRDLLVVPDAIINAWFSAEAEEQRAVSSLQTLLERAEAGEEIDTDDVNRVLSNFNLAGTAGSSASGSVRVVVSSARTYVIPVGFEFETLSGLKFRTTAAFTVSENPSGTELKLFKGTANYFFVIPVTCLTAGVAGNIDKGTALSITTALTGFVSATAYDTFSGGADVEDLSSIKARIPVALSTRGLLTATSTEACIRDRFDSSSNPIIAVSVVGYGNPAQIRDKHNPFGIGVGGRADVYVRNFTTPYTVTAQTEFEFDPTLGEYVASLAVPGMYNVKSVSDPDTETAASYTHRIEYVTPAELPEYHDFDDDNAAAELAGTVWRCCKVFVESSDTSELKKVFSVSSVCLPMATEIQNYLDEDSVRNVGCDYVVRCPAVCNVSMDITCRYAFGTSFDVESAKSALANYVNTSGFVGRLTRSEIACVLRGLGAKSVDIDDEYMLTGYVTDAFGTSHKLSGDALDISDIAVPEGLLTKDTCVFATSTGNINLVAIPV